jgi:hypothetical protein
MSRKNNSGVALLIAAAILVITSASALARPLGTEREAVVRIVTQIQKADYEGDRSTLQRLYGELAPFTGNKDFASRVFYWRGFALWRKAINGFNENVDKADLERDLQQAAEEFHKSASADPAFVDSKIALGSCFGLLAYAVGKKDAAEQQALIAKSRQAVTDARSAAPDNPRLLWSLVPCTGIFLQTAAVAKPRRWKPTKKAWKQSGATKTQRLIPWIPPGASRNC